MKKEKRFKKVVRYDEFYGMAIFFFYLILIGYIVGLSFTEKFDIWHLGFPAILTIFWFLLWINLRKVYFVEVKE